MMWSLVYILLLLLIATARTQGFRDKIADKKAKIRAIRLEKLVKSVEAENKIPAFFKPTAGSPAHRPQGPVVFSVAMDKKMLPSCAKGFTGTLRNTGYKGDIVLATSPGSEMGFLKFLEKTSCITYEVDTVSAKKDFEVPHAQFGYSVNVLRLFMYKWWVSMYDKDAVILLSDFRDVLFQSNPFAFRPHAGLPTNNQLVIFHENFPLKMIYRCRTNRQWLQTCYGDTAVGELEQNLVSCSGTVFGGRDAVLAYAHMMVEQLDPAVRWRNHPLVNTSEFLYKVQKQCKHAGIDQGFHNYLLHSKTLEQWVDVKEMLQGEGMVNTIGAFFGTKAVVQKNLTEWGILKGKPPQQTFHNWDGQLSPVVHQFDRFQQNHFQGRYWEFIKVISDQYK